LQVRLALFGHIVILAPEFAMKIIRSNPFHVVRPSRRLLLNLFGVIALFSLSGCGSTSGLQNGQGQAIASARKFSRVTVQNFKLALEDPDPKANGAPGYFADRIASELKTAGRFPSVARNAKPDANTLVIDGVVTHYKEGNAALRFFVGMGAGSSFFEADVYFRDAKGITIGKIKVDRNSWALGGGVAAAQNPIMFMNGAAEKIAQEAAKLAR
jgi:opacity protein-like surface antigen